MALDDFRDVYNLFFYAQEVVEIRAIGGLKGSNPGWEGSAFGQKPVVAGYFDNANDFAKAAHVLERAGASGIYFTLNPVLEAFLARCNNRLKAQLHPQTSDDNIKCIRWLPIDLDPRVYNGSAWVSRSGISSTEEEIQRAYELAKEIREWLEGELRLPEAIRASSGNGAHLLYRLPDLPNNDESRILVRDCLSAIANKFKSEEVDIDLGVFNPARIWKLYGTTARKGDPTDDRPHRKSKVGL